MARTLDQVIAALPLAEREKIAARAHELIAEEMSLQELRKAMHRTQVAVAEQLNVGQETVSKIEARADMLISTLQGYLNAMGAKLELVATFPDRPPIRLEGLGGIVSRRKREREHAAA